MAAMISQVQRSAAPGVRSFGRGPAQGLLEWPEGVFEVAISGADSGVEITASSALSRSIPV
jgi:hypothetical protein